MILFQPANSFNLKQVHAFELNQQKKKIFFFIAIIFCYTESYLHRIWVNISISIVVWIWLFIKLNPIPNRLNFTKKKNLFFIFVAFSRIRFTVTTCLQCLAWKEMYNFNHFMVCEIFCFSSPHQVYGVFHHSMWFLRQEKEKKKELNKYLKRWNFGKTIAFDGMKHIFWGRRLVRFQSKIDF